MQDDGRLVLTVTEAARALGISRALAYELVARGELPPLALGRRRVIPRRALEALIDSATPAAVPVEPTNGYDRANGHHPRVGDVQPKTTPSR